MSKTETLFVNNLYLFITKTHDIIFIYTKFNAESKEIKTFNPLIEAPKLSK
jgi:hypothetical protein